MDNIGEFNEEMMPKDLGRVQGSHRGPWRVGSICPSASRDKGSGESLEPQWGASGGGDRSCYRSYRTRSKWRSG